MPLTSETLPDYLRAKGWLREGEKAKVSPVHGGVSCALFKVRTPTRAFVVKQALEKLQVEVEWRSNPSRIFAEIECLIWAAKSIGPDCVPQIYGRDDEKFLYMMECAPAETESWKARLLRGEVDVGVAEKVGDFLGRVHALTRDDASISKRFQDKSRFDELRLDAYLRHTARAHPSLKPAIEEEVERLSLAEHCLVHGDFSPKNFLVFPDGRIWFLDWEVAHLGDAAFDCAFCLNHLLIKAQFLPDHRDDLFEAARAFWAAYRSRSTLVTFPRLGRLTGLLMLARVDGKSPVEYVKSDKLKDQIRTTAKSLILEPPEDLKQMLHFVAS